MQKGTMRKDGRINRANISKTALSHAPLPIAGGLPRPGVKGTADPDGTIVWYDCRFLVLEGKGWTDTESYYDRLPAKAKGLVPAEVWNPGHDTAGMCVRFTTDSPCIRVRWSLLREVMAMPHMPATGVSGIDLYNRDETGEWRFLGNGRPVDTSNTAEFSLTAGRENILYLPLYNGVTSVEIGIPKERSLAKPRPSPRDHRKPVVFYGTSITQGGCASRPGMAATAMVGRGLDVPVINLGFSGSGKMEPEMATLLAELDPSVYVLDCLWNMSLPMVLERIPFFVKTLRQSRRDTPVLLVEDSSFKNITPTEKGRMLRVMCRRLKKEGMNQLYFVSNKDMLGDDDEGTVDGCHPNDVGMMRQAAVFMKALAPLLLNIKQPR